MLRSKLTYRRVKSEEDDMIISCTIDKNGEDSESFFIAIDGIIEGLMATNILFSGSRTIHQIDEKEHLVLLDSTFKRIQLQFDIYEAFSEDANKLLARKITIEDDKLDDYLITMSKSKSYDVQGFQLWDTIDTTICFDNEIDVGYHYVEVEGTIESVRNALVYLLAHILINNFGYSDEESFRQTNEILKKSYLERFYEYKEEEEYFKLYLKPWIDAIIKEETV